MPNLYSDKALLNQEDDKLNRKSFAMRIADVIKKQTSKDCLVLGLYGAWGDGKSTVLNFIHIELVSTMKDVVVVEFNPWRFTDEETLLKGFYEKLAQEVTEANPSMIDKIEKIKKNKLQSRLEYLGDKAKKVAAFAKALGYPADWVSIAELISNASTEDLKHRLNTLLEKKKQRLVVIIDDIDRLDEDEVHAIFKLVKLNADFENTTYILAFDDKAIGQLVGKKYGGSIKAGLNFLEKIVQVPIHLPQPYPDALAEMAFEKINDVLNTSEFSLSADDGKKFGELYIQHFKPRVRNPRLILRYANALNFSLPLLHGEVNPIDLMCVEGVKVFYPNHYKLIIDNPNYFIEGYRTPGISKNENPKIEELKKKLEELSQGLLGAETQAIKQLLCYLFPFLKEAFENFVTSDHQYKLWFINKRICSPAYFPKYFTFSVGKGNVSNVEFDKFIDSIDEFEHKGIGLSKFKKLNEDVKTSNAVEYFRTNLDKMGWSRAKRICRYFSEMSDQLDRPFGPGSFFSSGFDQASFFINHSLKLTMDSPERVALGKHVMTKSPSLAFAMETCRVICLPFSDTEPETLNVDEAVEVFKALMERILSECGSIPVFVALPNISTKFLLLWSKVLGKESVQTYTNEHLLRDSNNAMKLLKSIINWSDFEGDFRYDEYKILLHICSPSNLRRQLIHVYGDKALMGNPAMFKYNEGQTDENILLQFEHAFNQDPSYPNQS